MHTQKSAESALAKCDLRTPVDVADTVDAKTGRDRRAFHFVNPDGSETTVEIDAEPSRQQLADLARHLPVPEEKRAETLATLEAEDARTETTRIERER
jgi:hypothetical protein